MSNYDRLYYGHCHGMLRSLESAGFSKDDINNMSMSELLTEYLGWEGIFGYAPLLMMFFRAFKDVK